jgi:hypothetical protein
VGDTCETYSHGMVLELTRLLLGLMITLFHRPLAGVIMRYERTLDGFFRSRGVNFPPPPSDATAQNIYFVVGVFICVLEAGKIWFGISS